MILKVFVFYSSGTSENYDTRKETNFLLLYIEREPTDKEVLSKGMGSDIVPQLNRTYHYLSLPYFIVFTSCDFFIKLPTLGLCYSMDIQRCGHDK